MLKHSHELNKKKKTKLKVIMLIVTNTRTLKHFFVISFTTAVTMYLSC